MFVASHVVRIYPAIIAHDLTSLLYYRWDRTRDANLTNYNWDMYVDICARVRTVCVCCSAHANSSCICSTACSILFHFDGRDFVELTIPKKNKKIKNKIPDSDVWYSWNVQESFDVRYVFRQLERLSAWDEPLHSHVLEQTASPRTRDNETRRSSPSASSRKVKTKFIALSNLSDTLRRLYNALATFSSHTSR